MNKPRFIVRTATMAAINPGDAQGVQEIRKLLEDEEALLGYDLKFITPINQGNGYTAYALLIFERKD